MSSQVWVEVSMTLDLEGQPDPQIFGLISGDYATIDFLGTFQFPVLVDPSSPTSPIYVVDDFFPAIGNISASGIEGTAEGSIGVVFQTSSKPPITCTARDHRFRFLRR